MKSITEAVFKEMVMPPIGTVMEKRYKVTYVNFGKMRLTATLLAGVEFPKMDENIMWRDRVYSVCYLNSKKKRFSAVFKKFAERIDKNPDDIADLI